MAQRSVPAAGPAASRATPRGATPRRNYSDAEPSYVPLSVPRPMPIDGPGFATYDRILGAEAQLTKTYDRLLPALPPRRPVPPPRALPADAAKSAEPPAGAEPDPAEKDSKPAADKDKSEAGGKKKGATGTGATKAIAGGDAAPGGGKSDGKAAGKGGQQLAKLPSLEKAPVAPLPMPMPETGGHHVARPGFRARMPAGGYVAERALDVHPAAVPPAAAGTSQEPVADYRSIYAAAVDESFGLYRRLMHEAELIVASADRRDRELALLHQSKLDSSLNLLDTALLANRERLAHGSAQLRLTLDTRADRLRRRIRGACATGIGRLEQRLRDYRDRIDPLRAQAKPIVAEAKGSPGKIAEVAKGATDKLNGVITSPAGAIPEEYGTMNAAAREAKVAYAPGYATCDKEMISKTESAIKDYLTKSFSCIECDAELAFQSLEGQVANMDGPGRKAIYAARDGALKSVDSTVKSLTEAIDANRDATERMLIQQHGQTRASLIRVAENNAERESETISEGAERQSEQLAAMAAGQPRAVQQMRDLLAEEAGSTPAVFARAVERAATRLKINLAKVSARQPRATADAAKRIGDGQLERARTFEERQQSIIANSDTTLEDIVAQAVLRLDKQIFDSIASMDDVPGNVLKQANAVLAPLGPMFETAVQDLSDSVGALGAQVHQVINGGDAMARQEAKVAERKKNAPPPPPAPAKTPGAKDPPAANAGPPPMPDACAGDCATRGKDKGEKKDSPGPPPPAPDGAKPGAGGTKTEAKGPEEGSENTPAGFRKLCEKIAADPLSAPQLSGFLKRALSEVTQKLSDRAGNVQRALATRFAPETGLLMESLRGLTKLQGQALSYQYYKLDASMTLEAKITAKYKDAVWSAKKTDDANRDAAIKMLHGDAVGGAMEELVAAFNFSNENQRIRDILLNLTPAQLEELKKDKRLMELAEQLDGRDREIFDALLAGNTAPAKAEGLVDQIDAINKEKRGEKRGDELAKKFTDASSDFHSPLEGDKKRYAADIFGFEAPTEAVRARNAEHWSKLQTEAAGLERVREKVGAQADPKQALLSYATREIEHRDSSGHGRSRRSRIVRDTVNPYHKEWLRNILVAGAESPEAKGARLLVEERRAKPDLKGLDAATHSGRGDARAGGGYDEKARAQGRQAAEDERLQILKASEQARANIEGGKPSEDMKAVKERLEKSFSAKLATDPTGKAVALGMLKSDAGDPIAVMEYAVKHENNELALMQLRRMDRREIQRFLDKYNAEHPHGPSLERQLGVFEHFGKSGTAFDGDKANELTIALKGVPQNDRERGEIGLLWMKLTKDQSGAMGRGLANSEYQAMIANYARLKHEMGVTDADIDARGNIKFKAGSGGTEFRGNFDKEGNFKPALDGSASGFESAVALAKVSATAYNEATDRIASFVTTALMVIAAVVTTILTGGAAASIWIPVLVTAGAGLIGMALTYSIRGERYTRDEMFRDFVMTMVQAVTAGIGAAVGAGLRGGAGAVKALATSMRVSEQTLANLVNKGVMMRGLTLMEEMAIGAGSSAVSGAVGAAVDPAARHSEDYGLGIFHGFLRGAIGGAAGAGVTRGVSAGIGSMARGIGARSGVNAVLNRGGSMELAARVGQMRARALSTSFLTEVGTRSLASGVSGAVTRVVDIGYNRIVLDQKLSASQFFEEVGWAFVQNAVQGFAEGAGDRAMRATSPQRAMEHAFTVKDQPQEFREAALGALIAEGRARGLIPMPPAPDTPPAGAPSRSAGSTETPPARHAAEAAAPRVAGAEGPAQRPITGVDEHGAVLPMARTAEGGAALPLHDNENDGAPHPAGAELRTAGRARTADEDAGTRTIVSANDNPDKPSHLRISLADTDPTMLGRIGVDSVLVHPDSRNREAANDNFGRLLNIDPTREAAVFRNPVTGEYIVIQGDAVSVASISVTNKIETAPGTPRLPVSRDGVPEAGGYWIMEHHYHPNRPGEVGTNFIRRLPSGEDGDFGVITFEADTHGHDERTSRIYFVDDGKLSYTDFGYNSKDPDARYWVDFPHPVTGARTREPFKTIEEYHAYVARVMTDPALASAGATGRARAVDGAGDGASANIDPARRVGAESATIADRMTPRNIGDLGAVSEQMQRVHGFEEQIAGRAPKSGADPEMGRAAMLNDAMEAVKRMGLVDRPDAMIRLTAVLNDPDVPDHVKPLVARAVLEASREALIRANKLDPGDELLLFFRGASSERLEDYKRRGIDPTLATNREEDVGPGLYMSRDLASAKGYGGEDSTILPFLVRRSELGNVLDISPGSPLRAQWEAFVMQNWHKHHLHPASAAMLGKKGPANPMEFGSLWFERANRVVLFDAFRAHLAATHADPAVRRVAANPDIVLSDLGGPVTYGNDRGFMTDQAAMKTRHVGDLMNDQLGFPRPSRANELGEDGTPRPLRARTADEGPEPTVKPLPEPGAPLPVPKHVDNAIAKVIARMGADDMWDASTTGMLLTDSANAFAALMAPDKATRREALERFRQGLVEKLGPELAERRMRQLDHLASRGGQAFRVEYEHSVRLDTISTQLDVLPTALAGWARESPVLLVFALRDPKRLAALYDRYIQKNTEPGSLVSLEFERHVLGKQRKGEAAFYDELRSLRTTYPGEDRSLAEMAMRLERQGITYRTPQEAPPLSTDAPLARPLAADKVTKGLRVDHAEHGRGTVQEIKDGTVVIHFDNQPPEGTTTLPHASDLLSRAPDPDPRFGDPEPFRTPAQIKQEIDKVLEFRSSALLPEFSQDADTGTVARITLGGEEFHGTSAGLDPPNYSLRNERRQKIYRELIEKFGLKDTGTTSQDAMFLGHAEAEAMLLAYDHFGRLPEVLEVFVDRSTCNDCRNNMMRLAKMLGVKELRVYYQNQSNPPLVRR